MKPLFTPERRICMVIEEGPTSVVKRGNQVVKEIKKVTERRAFFHLFAAEAMPLEPSPLRGGHPGGQYSKALAIVEYEDGTVDTVNPESIRFLDTKGLMEQYAWEVPERDCLTCKYNEDGTNRDHCRKCEAYSEWEAVET